MVFASFSPLEVKRVEWTLSLHRVTRPCQLAFPEPESLGIRKYFCEVAWWLVVNRQNPPVIGLSYAHPVFSVAVLKGEIMAHPTNVHQNRDQWTSFGNRVLCETMLGDNGP